MSQQQLASPTIRPTHSPFNFDPAELMRETVGQDHVLAAQTAMDRQVALERYAKRSNMTVTEYLRSNGMMPCADYATRPDFDPMEAEHMNAILIATKREKRLEALAAAEGMTVEDYSERRSKLGLVVVATPRVTTGPLPLPRTPCPHAP